MPSSKTITNPTGVWGLTPDADPTIQYVVNNSGGTLLPGDVVCFTTDVTGVLATTTTTASDVTVLGVVAAQDNPSDSLRTAAAGDTYAAGAIMPVVIKGPARINIAANTVAASAALSTSTAAKVAAVAATAGSVGALQALIGSFIAIALESQAAKDANNTIRCYVNKM